LYYGIQLLISSYDLNDPFIFIMIFFADNQKKPMRSNLTLLNNVAIDSF
jgi:hypothetical protein